MKFMKYLLTAVLLTIISAATACSSPVAEKNIAENSAVQSGSDSTKQAANKQIAANDKTADTKKDAPIEIFDGRKDLDYKDYSKADNALAQTEFDRKNAEIKEKFGESYCNDEDGGKVSVAGVANGSFTKPNANQKAVFYTVCSSGSSHFGVGGIIVFENEKAVSHYVYGKNGLDSGISVAPDVNKNGVNELILIDFQVHQGYGGGGISLVEFADGKFNHLGQTATYSDNSGSVEDEKDSKSTASRISVDPAAQPVFYRESYEKNGSEKNWKLVKKSEKFSLSPLEKQYVEGFMKIEG